MLYALLRMMIIEKVISAKCPEEECDDDVRDMELNEDEKVEKSKRKRRRKVFSPLSFSILLLLNSGEVCVGCCHKNQRGRRLSRDQVHQHIDDQRREEVVNEQQRKRKLFPSAATQGVAIVFRELQGVAIWEQWFNIDKH